MKMELKKIGLLALCTCITTILANSTSLKEGKLEIFTQYSPSSFNILFSLTNKHIVNSKPQPNITSHYHSHIHNESQDLDPGEVESSNGSHGFNQTPEHKYENDNLNDTVQFQDTATRVNLPPLPCGEDVDCEKWSEPLVCAGGQCVCQPPMCWRYRIENHASRYVFFCDNCHGLGSWCNETVTCNDPGICMDDGYCHCPKGYHVEDICVTTDMTMATNFAVGGAVFIIVTCMGVICISWIKKPPWRRDGGCCSCCKGGTSQNETSESTRHIHTAIKSPAFTIFSHYLPQESLINPNESPLVSEETRSNRRRRSSRWSQMSFRFSHRWPPRATTSEDPPAPGEVRQETAEARASEATTEVIAEPSNPQQIPLNIDSNYEVALDIISSNISPGPASEDTHTLNSSSSLGLLDDESLCGKTLSTDSVKTNSELDEYSGNVIHLAQHISSSDDMAHTNL